MRSLLLCLLLMALLPLHAEGTPEKPLMKDFIAFNGHTIGVKPDLYAPLFKVIRDYHPMAWDVKSPGEATQYPMTTNKVNWIDDVYGKWKKVNWDVDCSIQFENFKRPQFKDLAKDSFEFGKSFAKFFGPSGEHKLVTSAEVGNEPGSYSGEDYRIIFENMAKGFKEGDPKMKVVTCNVVNHKKGGYDQDIRSLEGLENLIDVLNIHTYAMAAMWPTYKRSYPEDPKITFLKDVNELIEWRDKHAAGKPIWVTEFGWDSSTKKPNNPKDANANKWIGNTDTEQAQYLVRAYLVFSEMPVARAYMYFFNDEDQPSFHASSGVTRHFKPKASYYSIRHLQQTLGDYRFSKVIEKKENEVYAYEYVHGTDAKKKIWAVWSPTGSQREADVSLADSGLKFVKSEVMPLEDKAAAEGKVQVDGPNLKVSITEIPTYLFLEAR